MVLLHIVFLCLVGRGSCSHEHTTCKTADCNPAETWADEVNIEEQGLKMLQVKGSKFTPEEVEVAAQVWGSVPGPAPANLKEEFTPEELEVAAQIWGSVPGPAPANLKEEDEPMPVMMKATEEQLLRKLLQSSKNYVEFGAGGSTVAAMSYPNLQSIQVIESSPVWLSKLKERTDVQQAEEEGRLRIHFADIGPTVEYGYPESTGITDGFPSIDKDLAKKMPAYSDMKSLDMKNVDFVLVDGRFRVACFLNALKQTQPGTLIAIHDYFREHYHVVEKYAQMVEFADTLRVFKARDDIDRVELDLMISKYQTVPALLSLESSLDNP